MIVNIYSSWAVNNSNQINYGVRIKLLTLVKSIYSSMFKNLHQSNLSLNCFSQLMFKALKKIV